MTAANADDDPFRVVRTFALARRCRSVDCRPPFTRAPIRDGSVREYGDGVQVWTCATCCGEWRISGQALGDF